MDKDKSCSSSMGAKETNEPAVKLEKYCSADTQMTISE